MSSTYSEFVTEVQSIADISFAAGVLNWDQETYMPQGGAGLRARQLATLAGLVHERATGGKLGSLLEVLGKDVSLDEVQRCNVKYVNKQYQRALKLPREFVVEMSHTVSEALSVWQQAKPAGNFEAFAPHLEKIVNLKRRECELLGYTAHPYDALLDEFEPGLTTAEVEQLFADVRKDLVPFVKQIAQQAPHSDELLKKHYPKDKQFAFSETLLRIIGFDFGTGRQDISLHPFTINFGATDVRVTTKIDEHNLSDMLTGTIHEGGHALYEQGLPANGYGLPSGEYVSLGIHESQSRLWENNVGRSLEFCKAIMPQLQAAFPEQMNGHSANDLFQALNVVRPSLIRIMADELTYHFHIMVRFETEKALIEGSLAVKDVPGFWNSRVREYLGIDVPHHGAGCLQDVHWSHGSLGYFPTYSIGSFYAAQFFAAAEKQIDGLHEQIERGELKSLLQWLREHIHRHGKQYSARELCERITGEPLSFSYFMQYARKKYGSLYQL
ncbi:MAG: carboxypeptidase M32 [Bacteroidia bacterium]|jgi:carboxypeptidase Taq|nr:carboxypeptidase M32 [Bacteroidia bacterium]